MNIIKKIDIILGEETVTSDVDVTPTKDNATVIGMFRRKNPYSYFRYGPYKFDKFEDAHEHMKKNYKPGRRIHGIVKTGKILQAQEVRIKV